MNRFLLQLRTRIKAALALMKLKKWRCWMPDDAKKRRDFSAFTNHKAHGAVQKAHTVLAERLFPPLLLSTVRRQHTYAPKEIQDIAATFGVAVELCSMRTNTFLATVGSLTSNSDKRCTNNQQGNHMGNTHCNRCTN